MTTIQPTKPPCEQPSVVLRLLATPDPELVSVLTEAGWTPVLPDDSETPGHLVDP